MKKLYKFVASSSLSFAVIHCGRMMYVNFSAFFRGKSTYHTTDRELAEKIRAHKWYREGRITETIEEDEDVIHDENDVNSVLQETEVKQDTVSLESGCAPIFLRHLLSRKKKNPKAQNRPKKKAFKKTETYKRILKM